MAAPKKATSADAGAMEVLEEATRGVYEDRRGETVEERPKADDGGLLALRERIEASKRLGPEELRSLLYQDMVPVEPAEEFPTGDALRTLRERAGLSLQFVARVLGFPGGSHVERVERGERAIVPEVVATGPGASGSNAFTWRAALQLVTLMQVWAEAQEQPDG